MNRVALYVLLLIVAGAAAVLSFDALRALAETCGFRPEMSWLLPVVVDAGAAAASIVWLASWTPDGATTYGRALALTLLGSSIGGNALGHGLAAAGIVEPDWRIVVAVSAVAPAVLAALVHLVVLVGRPRTAEDDDQDEAVSEPDLEIVPAALVAPTPSQAQAGADLAAGGGTVPDDGEDQEDDGEDELPDRTTVVNTANLAAVAADLRTVRDEMGRRPTRDEVKQMYRISSDRASQVLRYLVWGTPSSRQDEAEQLAEDLAVLRDEQDAAAVR